jgi:hypothetical protein
MESTPFSLTERRRGPVCVLGLMQFSMKERSCHLPGGVRWEASQVDTEGSEVE